MVRNIIITAGGTSERIDDVRMISNFSSGRLGLAVARAFLEAGAMKIEKIYYLCDRNTNAPTDDRVEVIRVMGVQGLLEALEQLLTTKKIDAVIHAMAVSDYTVKEVTTLSAIRSGGEPGGDSRENSGGDSGENSGGDSGKPSSGEIPAEGKISSEIDDLVIVLKRTPKVIGEIKKLQEDTILVGFKLLTGVKQEVLIETGHKLLQKNRCSMVLANDLTEITGEKHVGYLIAPDGTYEKLSTKKQIAEAIVRKTRALLAEMEGMVR